MRILSVNNGCIVVQAFDADDFEPTKELVDIMQKIMKVPAASLVIDTKMLTVKLELETVAERQADNLRAAYNAARKRVIARKKEARLAIDAEFRIKAKRRLATRY